MTSYRVNLFDSFVVEAQDEEHAIVAAQEHLLVNGYLLVPVELEESDGS